MSVVSPAREAYITGGHARHVMAGVDPAIHVLLAMPKQDVDARVKLGHDNDRVPFT
jgi:hypothetical protein